MGCLEISAQVRDIPGRRGDSAGKIQGHHIESTSVYLPSVALRSDLGTNDWLVGNLPTHSYLMTAKPDVRGRTPAVKPPSVEPAATENAIAYEWAGARGETWCAHLTRMEAMLMPVNEPLIRALALDAPYRIADIACGGGGTTTEILRRAPAGSVAHGFDISDALINAARGRAQRDELGFEVADVATATARVPYDRMASRFGVMFFADPHAAFRNLACWLAPGGRFAFAVWGMPADNPWMMVVREVVAEIVAIPPFDPDAPTLFRYAEASKLLTELETVGFAELDARDWCGALPFGGGLPATEAARFALTSFASYADALASAGGQALAEAQRSLTERLLPHEQNGTVRMNARVHIVTGTR